MLFSFDDRVIKEGMYIAENGATVRQTASVFGISKSAVHKDMTERLMYYDEKLYIEVRKVLDFNLSERHMRGGIATREKYKGKTGKKDLPVCKLPK